MPPCVGTILRPSCVKEEGGRGVGRTNAKLSSPGIRRISAYVQVEVQRVCPHPAQTLH